MKNKSRKESIMGHCHICGQWRELTYEHIPPKKAFNNRRTISISFENAVSFGPDDVPQGKVGQKGIGQYTLCSICNNNTGAWYGDDFVKFCYLAMEIMTRAQGKSSIHYPYNIYPLRIIKQILAMFLSINPVKFSESNQILRRFILNKNEKFLDPHYRFFLYYNISGILRTAGNAAVIDFARGSHVWFSEMNYPPFGYVMTLESELHNRNLFEITSFSRYSYNELKQIFIKAPVLPTYTHIPGMYPSLEQARDAHKRQKH